MNLNKPDNLGILREKINQIDHEFLKLLAERFRISKLIAKEKVKMNLDIIQNKRYESLLYDRINYGNKYGLDDNFTKKLFAIIHKESIRLQLKTKRNQSLPTEVGSVVNSDYKSQSF